MLHFSELTSALTALWRDWTVAIAAPLALILLSYVLSAAWLPLVAFVLATILHTIYIQSMASTTTGCPLMPFTMSRIMLWCGIVMLIMAVCHHYGLFVNIFGHINPKVPYVPALVIGPIVCLVVGYYVFLGKKSSFYHRCQVMYGTPDDLGPMAVLCMREGRYQLMFFYRIALILTALTYIYYWVLYIDVTVTTPDKFVFVWVPVIFLTLSILFMALRYYHLPATLAIKKNDGSAAAETTVRFIIVDSNRFYLTPTDVDETLTRHKPSLQALQPTRLDTPVSVTIPYRKNVSLEEARELLAKALGTDEFELRFMYATTPTGGTSNTFRFIATVPDDNNLQFPKFTIKDISHFSDTRALKPRLASELHRLYIITMAWKSYDLEGRRLYKIKHYKPVFRLQGINKWPVDFNDPHWLEVARLNQDRPLFGLRRFMQRFF